LIDSDKQKTVILLLVALIYGAVIVNAFIDCQSFWRLFGEYRFYAINLVHFVPFIPLLYKKRFRLLLCCFLVSSLGNDFFFGAFKSGWHYDLFYYWKTTMNPFDNHVRWWIVFPPYIKIPNTPQRMFVNMIERTGQLCILLFLPWETLKKRFLIYCARA